MLLFGADGDGRVLADAGGVMVQSMVDEEAVNVGFDIGTDAVRVPEPAVAAAKWAGAAY